MALLGWYPEDGAEFMPMGELKRKFDVARCSKAPAMFDFFLNETTPEPADFKPESMNEGELKKLVNKKTKLNWLNNKYIRSMELRELWPLAKGFIAREPELAKMITADESRMKEIFDRVRMYLDTLDDAAPFFKEMLKQKIEVEKGEAEQMMAAPEAGAVISAFRELVVTNRPATPEAFSEIMKQTGAKTGAKGKTLFMTIRVASTGSTHGLELPNLFAILGPDQVLERIAQVAG